jgi:putative phosphoribosyl transferase
MESEMSLKSRLIYIPVGREEIQGDLRIPENSTAMVAFAHGSGSSRHSPRNKYVADVLNTAGICTLLMDLLTPNEELLDFQSGQHRFDIALLAERLSTVTIWLRTQSSTQKLHTGYFGASTGAAAAIVAAANHPDIIEAVVSRGGRPDLAGDSLTSVPCPTLLIVGGNDHSVIELNRQAATQLKAEHRLEIIPNAGHLFEEQGALEQVAGLAARWFEKHLIPGHRHAA